MTLAAQIRFTPGTVINRRISGHPSACWAISRSTAAISPVEELDAAQPGVDRLTLLERELETREPPAALDAKQVRARRLALQAALQDRLDLVLGPRPGAHELLTTREPATQHAAALVRHPHRLKLPGPQQPGQRARVEPVGLRARPDDPGVIRLTTTTRSTCGSRIRATSQQLPVTSSATRSVRIRLCASSPSPSGVLGTRPAVRTSPSSQIATTQKSRCTPRPIARPTHLANAILTSATAVDGTGEPAEQRHRPIRARGTIQASRRGGRTKSPGSKPIAQTGLPARVPPTKAPVPDRPTLRAEPDRASNEHFHAANRGSAARTRTDADALLP
jgi:hypothetical protein